MKIRNLFKKKINVALEFGNPPPKGKTSAEEAIDESTPIETVNQKVASGKPQSNLRNRRLIVLGNWARNNAGFSSVFRPLISEYTPELKKAGIYVDENDFLAFWSLLIFISSIAAFTVGVFTVYAFMHRLVAALVMGASIGLMGFSTGLGIPMFYISSKKSSRKTELEAVMPFIVERFASYVEAGAPLKELITSFTNRKIYGVWVDEVNDIRKEIELLGISPSEALMNAARRSPSEQLSNFLSSFVLGTKSSLDLKSFIATEKENIMKEKRGIIDKFLENLGALTESVISLFVILPITILTMGMVASTIGGGFFGLNPTALIVVTSFVIMPLLFLVAMESVSSITPRMRIFRSIYGFY